MAEAVALNELSGDARLSRAAVLSDLDGCLVAGGTVLDGARDFAARVAQRLWIVSNNSTHTAKGLAADLAKISLPVSSERIVLAGELAVARLAARHPGARTAIFATPEIRALAQAHGLRPDAIFPEVVLLARDPAFDFAALRTLMRHVRAGVPVWLTNPDGAHPRPDGAPEPETGALWAAACAGTQIAPAAVVGKPAPEMVLHALARAGVPARDAVLLGDNPATDGRAARAAGVEFIAVRPPAGTAVQTEALQC